MIDIKYCQSSETLSFTFKKLDYDSVSSFTDKVNNEINSIITKYDNKQTLKIDFDLSEVEYASSAFLRVVMMSVNSINKKNFKVTHANQFIRDLFKTSGLDSVIEITGAVDEVEVFEPKFSFKSKAHLKDFNEYKRMHKMSIENPDKFWGEMADEHLTWFEKYDTVSEWKEPYAKWFLNGKLNACYNCVDVHAATNPDKAAIIWEGEPQSDNKPAEIKTITYKDLLDRVQKFANVLKNNGIEKGDRVVIYMPMIPESVVAMLACARIGAIHSVIFAGFSAEAIAERVGDSSAKLILTTDGTYRRGSILNLKAVVDSALEILDKNNNNTVTNVIVHKHLDCEVEFKTGRDLWLNEEEAKVAPECKPEVMDSEDKLFILYTSGSTGKPKGIVHSTAGYLLQTKLSHKYVFDIKKDDLYWCTADIGWITGHSYIVYGPLANGATLFMYEGAPNFPNPGRFWDIIERHKISILYTAPTAIRSFMKWGDEWPAKYDLSSLRLLGSVGEPINPEAWYWYNKHIGNEKCPIVDTWWQTETGAIMISALPGAIATKPGSASLPFFGVDPEVINPDGEKQHANQNGTFLLKKPWPSMLRGLWNDHDRYVQTYWSDNKGVYTTGDSARCDSDGYFWIIGREDDVINVSGHRIGTAEVESALVSHHSVAEAAAVGIPDDIKGSLLVVFVTVMNDVTATDELSQELRKYVANKLGAVVRPDEIRYAEALPKTRSGKIMRRLLKQIAAGTEVSGDMTTLEDFKVVESLSGN